MSAKDPKFKKGDLVYVKDDDNLLEGLNLAIIISEPMLMFIYKSGPIPTKKQNYWVYDVVVGDQLIKEIPEQILKVLNDEDKTKNS
mgnify:CR=1 FL=1